MTRVIKIDEEARKIFSDRPLWAPAELPRNAARVLGQKRAERSNIMRASNWKFLQGANDEALEWNRVYPMQGFGSDGNGRHRGGGGRNKRRRRTDRPVPPLRFASAPADGRQWNVLSSNHGGGGAGEAAARAARDDDAAEASPRRMVSLYKLKKMGREKQLQKAKEVEERIYREMHDPRFINHLGDAERQLLADAYSDNNDHRWSIVEPPKLRLPTDQERPGLRIDVIRSPHVVVAPADGQRSSRRASFLGGSNSHHGGDAMEISIITPQGTRMGKRPSQLSLGSELLSVGTSATGKLPLSSRHSSSSRRGSTADRPALSRTDHGLSLSIAHAADGFEAPVSSRMYVHPSHVRPIEAPPKSPMAMAREFFPARPRQRLQGRIGDARRTSRLSVGLPNLSVRSLSERILGELHEQMEPEKPADRGGDDDDDDDDEFDEIAIGYREILETNTLSESAIPSFKSLHPDSVMRETSEFPSELRIESYKEDPRHARYRKRLSAEHARKLLTSEHDIRKSRTKHYGAFYLNANEFSILGELNAAREMAALRSMVGGDCVMPAAAATAAADVAPDSENAKPPARNGAGHKKFMERRKRGIRRLLRQLPVDSDTGESLGEDASFGATARAILSSMRNGDEADRTNALSSVIESSGDPELKDIQRKRLENEKKLADLKCAKRFKEFLIRSENYRPAWLNGVKVDDKIYDEARHKHTIASTVIPPVLRRGVG